MVIVTATATATGLYFAGPALTSTGPQIEEATAEAPAEAPIPLLQ